MLNYKVCFKYSGRSFSMIVSSGMQTYSLLMSHAVHHPSAPWLPLMPPRCCRGLAGSTATVSLLWFSASQLLGISMGIVVDRRRCTQSVPARSSHIYVCRQMWCLHPMATAESADRFDWSLQLWSASLKCRICYQKWGVRRLKSKRCSSLWICGKWRQVIPMASDFQMHGARFLHMQQKHHCGLQSRTTARGGGIHTSLSSFLGSKVQIVHTYSSLTFAASDMQSRSPQHL